MGLVIGVIGGDAREQILKILARHEISVGQRRLAKRRQIGIPRFVNENLAAMIRLDRGVEHHVYGSVLQVYRLVAGLDTYWGPTPGFY